MNENEPTIIFMISMTLYLIVRDILAPMIRHLLKKAPQSTEPKTETSIAVLETKVSGIEKDVSEIKMDIKYLRKHNGT